MATDCVSLISAGIVPNCNDPITKGYEHKGIIINWDDIDFTATTFSGANTISDLVLKDGKRPMKSFKEEIRHIQDQPLNWPLEQFPIR